MVGMIFPRTAFGRDGFTPIIEKNLMPDRRKTTISLESRIPGPGELGFRYRTEKKLILGK